MAIQIGQKMGGALLATQDKRKIKTAIFFFIISFLFKPSFLPAQKEMNSIAIHQEIKFNVSPRRVYDVLLSSGEFSACTKKSFDNFSSRSASIDSLTGGTFSLFDGHIVGRILELVPGQRIVEAWRVVDWPPGVYSIAKFELTQQGSGTLLIFDHTGFPEGLKEHLAQGWQQHYWDALVKYF